MDKKENPITQYIKEGGKEEGIGSELFKSDDTFIDQKTELSSDEIRLITGMHHIDMYLQGKLDMGKRTVYSQYFHKFMRLMVSHERKSRGEFVDVHRRDGGDSSGGNFFNFGGQTPKLK